jgi:uncharacterized RDD family membrane protein YckC
MPKVSGPVDDLLVVETPERVELHFPLASLGNRFLACAIDHTIQLIVLLLLLLIGDYLDHRVSRAGLDILASLGKVNIWIKAFGILLVFVLFFGYFILFESLWNGQTPGKRWMGLRVIQQDGRPVTFFAIMLRNIIRLADMMVPPFYSVGLVTIFATRHSKRLGDFAANTVVIKEWSGQGLSFDQIFSFGGDQTGEGRHPARVEFDGPLDQISPAEILIVEICLRRCPQLPLARREWIAWRVATPLLEKMRPVFDPDVFTYEGFLRELQERMRQDLRAGRGSEKGLDPGPARSEFCSAS